MSDQGKAAIRDYFKIKRRPDGNEDKDAVDLINWIIKYEKIILHSLNPNASNNVIPMRQTNPKGTQ